MENKDSVLWQHRWKDEIIMAGLLLAFAFFINAGIRIRGLSIDDLYLWSCYGEQSFPEFVFPLGSSRFRSLYYLAAYLELGLVGNHVSWFVPVNIVLNGIVAYTICRFGRRLSHNKVVGLLCGVLYLLSRMSYYQISQVHGLMETMGLWAAIGILFFLYCYVNDPGHQLPCFWAANGLYFAACFIHERYMVLLPLLYAAFLMKKSRKVRDWLLPGGLFILIQFIRLAVIGTVVPEGAGGTSVLDTLDLKQALVFAAWQVLYLFGINMGEKSLSGLSWQESSRWIKVLVVLADAVIAAVIAAFIIKIIRSRWDRKHIFKNCLLFFLFISLCIGCSSVTIHVELRWVYVSMTGFWMWLAYMCGVIARPSAKEQESVLHRLPDYNRAIACAVLMLGYTIFMIPVETYYRGKYPNMAFWNLQEQYNSLAEQTYEKYGDELFGKKIYILENRYQVSEFHMNTFFKVFKTKRNKEDIQVFFVDNIRDFGQVSNNMLILMEEPAFHGYQDITEAMRKLKCEPVYGYYEDGWMEEKAKIRVMTGSSGTIRLQLMYPGTMEGHEETVIFQDGELSEKVQITENIIYVELKAKPYQFTELDFENNFHIDATQDQKGVKRLSLMVRITAD